MILPRVKSQQNKTNEYLLPFDIKMSVDAQYAEKLKILMNYFFPKSNVEFGEETPQIIAVNKKQDNIEGYYLKIDDNGIQIEYESYRGLRNALATVSMAATANESGFLMNHTEISDYPVIDFRSILLDLGRGTRPQDSFLADIALIAKAKMSYLHLHFSDTLGVSVKLDCIPEECLFDNYYTKDFLREIAVLADALALDIIPEFDMPGHSTAMLKCFPEIGCDVPEDIHNTHWTTCPSTEYTYVFYENVIREICEIFPGKYFHIGGDELDFADAPDLNALCHWNQCRKCQQMYKDGKVADRQELYYYFVNRIHSIVKKYGRQMIMWSDQIDCMRPIGIPTDVIMQFWRVAREGRGPFEGCSLNGQLKMGYKVINSTYHDTYIDFERYMNADSIADWRWDKRPEVEDEYKDGIIGSETCAWDFGNRPNYNFYDRTLASAMIVMADKFWNGDIMTFDEEYEKGMTKAVLGTTAPYGINIFKCFGSVVLPATSEFYGYYDKIKCSTDEIGETIEQLREIKPFEIGSELRINAYIDGMQKVIEHMNAEN